MKPTVRQRAESFLATFSDEGRAALRNAIARATCRNRGHTFVRDSRGAPVADFEVCKRCGKIGDSFRSPR